VTGALAVLSVLVCVATVAAYATLLGVPAVRNHPEGYVAAFAIAATVAGLAVALRRRWYAWLALGLSIVLLVLGSWVNFVLARVPDTPVAVRVGEAAPDFTLPDAAGRPTSLADYRGKKPVVLVFYRGSW
jgi:cytochrome oxidase Cu insertion factor (SCO1/SenC/PrrC family)